MDNFGEKIYTLRTNNNLSQDELAQKLGVSRQAISKWERDEGLPDIINIKRIAEVFEVSIDELLSNENKITPTKSKITIYELGFGIFSFVIGISLLGLIIIQVFNSISLILNIFSVEDINLNNKPYLYLVPLSMVLLLYVLSNIYNIHVKETHQKSRNVLIISIGLMITFQVLFLLTGYVGGFEYIFIYIILFLILLIGLISTIYHDFDSEDTKTRKYTLHKTHFTKFTFIFVSLGILLLGFNIAKEQFLVKNVRYISEYSYQFNDGNNNYIVKFDENNYQNEETRKYTYNFKYEIFLFEDIEEVTIDIYLGDLLLGSEKMIPSGPIEMIDDNTPKTYSYWIDSTYETEFYTLVVPSLNIDDNELNEISFKITYTSNNEETSFTSTIDDNFTRETSYDQKNIWIWEYKDLLKN